MSYSDGIKTFLSLQPDALEVPGGNGLNAALLVDARGQVEDARVLAVVDYDLLGPRRGLEDEVHELPAVRVV